MKTFKLLFITVAVLSSWACDDATTEGSAQLHESNSIRSVIYGQDDRLDAYAHPDAVVRERADLSTGILAIPSNLADPFSTALYDPPLQESDKFFHNENTLAFTRNLCEDERYSQDIAVGKCSVTLIDDDLVLTAGHCLRTKFLGSSTLSCENQRYVFNYRNVAPSTLADMTPDDVFRCREEVVHSDGPDEVDYAIIRLDRPATPRFKPAPVKTSPDFKFENNQSIVVLGSPFGIPTKVSPGAIVSSPAGNDERLFSMNPDVFSLSSGSAVYDAADMSVGGINVSGPRYGLTLDEAASCERYKVCSDSGCDDDFPLNRGVLISEPINAMCSADPTASYRLCGHFVDLGDVNGDGAIDETDALLVSQYVVGYNPQHFFIDAADVDEDGEITPVDALIIGSYAAGQITSLPFICPCPAGCTDVQTVSSPLVLDGPQDGCYYITEMGNYLNNWENILVTLNGEDVTNTFVDAQNFPAPLNGGYYLYVSAGASWSHIEIQ